MTPAIQSVDLKKSFRDVRRIWRMIPALKGLTFTVAKGEVFGLLGPNGAGKTTFIKVLVGVSRPTSGECKIFGESSQQPGARRKLGYLPERPYFHDFLTAEEFLLFHGRLAGLNSRQGTVDMKESRIPKLLETVDLMRARHQRLRTFSKGMLQRIGIAQALIHDPEIVVLDEPMSGLDPVGRKEVRDLIIEVAKQGKTVLLSTHIIPDVDAICTSVGFIHHGELRGVGRIDELLENTTNSVEIQFKPAAGMSPATFGAPTRRIDESYILEITKTGELSAEIRAGEILKSLVSSGALIQRVHPRRENLEDLFFKVRGERHVDHR